MPVFCIQLIVVCKCSPYGRRFQFTLQLPLHTVVQYTQLFYDFISPCHWSLRMMCINTAKHCSPLTFIHSWAHRPISIVSAHISLIVTSIYLWHLHTCMMWSILSYTYSLSAHIIIGNSHTLHHSRYCHGLQCSLGCNTLPNRLGHSPSAQSAGAGATLSKPLHLTIFIFPHRQCLTIVHHFKLAIPCCSEHCQNTQEIWAHCCVPHE